MRVCVCNCGSHIAVSFTHTLSTFLANFPPSSTIAHYSIARDTVFISLPIWLTLMREKSCEPRESIEPGLARLPCRIKDTSVFYILWASKSFQLLSHIVSFTTFHRRLRWRSSRGWPSCYDFGDLILFFDEDFRQLDSFLSDPWPSN